MKKVYLHIEYDKWVFDYLRATVERYQDSLEALGFTLTSSPDSHEINTRKAIDRWCKQSTFGQSTQDTTLFLSIDATHSGAESAAVLLANATSALASASPACTDVELSVVVLLSDPIDLQSRRYLTELDAHTPSYNLTDFLAQQAPTNFTQYLRQFSDLLQATETSNTPLRIINLSRLPLHRDSEFLSAVLELNKTDLIESPQTQDHTQFLALERGVIASLQSAFTEIDEAAVSLYLQRLLVDRTNNRQGIHGRFNAPPGHPAIKHFVDSYKDQIDDFNVRIPQHHRLQTSPTIDNIGAVVADETRIEQPQPPQEATQLDAFYGRLISDAVVRNILEVLAGNLSQDGKIVALRTICEELPAVYPRVDLKFWNAYAHAVRQVSRIKAQPAIQKAAALRRKVHSLPKDSTDPDNADSLNGSSVTDTRAVRISTEQPPAPDNTKPDQNKIFLHVGHTKTGSSYIQSVLARNQHTLRENGIYYPLTENDLEQAERGNVTCGNRSVIDDDEELQRAFSVEGSLLLSNESMWKRFLDPDFTATFAEAAHRTNRSVKLFMCIRDPIAHNRSRYMQLSQTGIVDMSISKFFTTKAVRDQRSRFKHFARLMEICKKNNFELTIFDYTEIRSNLLNVFCSFLELDNGLELKVPQAKVNRSMGATELAVRRTLNALYTDQAKLPRDRNYLRHLIDQTAELPFSLPTPDAAALQQFSTEIEKDVDQINSLLPHGLKYNCDLMQQPSVNTKSQENEIESTRVDDDDHYGRLLAETIALLTLDALSGRCDSEDQATVNDIKKQFLATTSSTETYSSLRAELDQQTTAIASGWRQRIGRLHRRLGFG